jgi:BASS family bile acid:Na+ symporter
MDNMIFRVVRNRNTILIVAVVLGLLFGDYASHIKNYTIYVLAIVMLVSTTGISLKSLVPFKNTLNAFGVGIVFNYLIFSGLAILLARSLFTEDAYFLGFVVIAFSPPGIAVIPFTQILNGNSNYTILATLGSYLAAVILLPFIFDLFPGNSSLSSTDILYFLVKIIIIPLILSRLLLLKPIRPFIEAYRGRITDWGFAIIIFVAVGLNRAVFFEFSSVLIKSVVILTILTFVLGFVYEKLNKVFKWVDERTEVSQKLLLTIKSSGFTATTAMALFGKEAAVPSAVMAIMVLVYLIFLSLKGYS